MTDKIKQDTGLNRNSIDKFYTKKNIVKMCIRSCNKYLKINNNDLIIEPSAGNGSFIKQIKKCLTILFFMILILIILKL